MDALRSDYPKNDMLPDPRKCPTCLRAYEWAEPRRTFTWFEAVIVAATFLVLGAAFQHWEAEQNIYRFENVKVTKKLDAWRYKMKFASGEYAVWFCKNYKPCIPEGAVLTSLRYEDDGDCWDIRPAGLGYNLLQDEQGNSIDENGRIVFDAQKDSCQ